MIRSPGRFLLFALAVSALLAATRPLHAATINSSVGVNGTFGTTLSGSGVANLTSASGNFRQWVLFTHTNIGVSANPQSVNVNVPTVGPVSLPASGDVDFAFDPYTPGTPQQIHSFNGDLNGETAIPFTINIDPMSINTSLGTFQLRLTVAGSITDLDFASAPGSVPADPNYSIPGEFKATISGNVTGQLVNVPILGSIDLGTITTIDASDLFFDAEIPGLATLSDLSGGLGPFPSDLLANFAASLPFDIPIPVDIPLEVAINQSVPNGQSGFSSLNINGNLAATLNLGNPNYNLTGTIPGVLVPEPGSLVLALVGAAGLGLAVLRRKK